MQISNKEKEKLIKEKKEKKTEKRKRKTKKKMKKKSKQIFPSPYAHTKPLCKHIPLTHHLSFHSLFFAFNHRFFEDRTQAHSQFLLAHVFSSSHSPYSTHSPAHCCSLLFIRSSSLSLDFAYRFRVPNGKSLKWRATCGENMQIICTQSGRKPFFGTWWSLTGGPNPLLLWSLFILLLSTLESLVLPSLNNSTRKSTGKSTLGKLCHS